MGKQTLTIREPSVRKTIRQRGLASRQSFASVALLLGFMFACASAPLAPDWVQDSPSRYPAERYFRGIASDTNPEIAAKLALDSVSKETQDEPGAQVAETWYDEKTELHWAIALLERKPILERLASESEQLDDKISAALRAGKSDPPEQALPQLAGAAPLIPIRDRLRDRISYLGGTPKSSDDLIEAQKRELSDALAKIKKELRIEVTSFEIDGRTGAPGDALNRNRRALLRKVVSQGFTPGSTDEGWGMDSVWLRVRSTVALDRLELHPNDRLVAVHWDAAVEITDVTGGGDIVGVLAAEGRAVHATEAQARRLADAAAREFAASAFEEWLIDRATQTNPSF